MKKSLDTSQTHKNANSGILVQSKPAISDHTQNQKPKLFDKIVSIGFYSTFYAVGGIIILLLLSYGGTTTGKAIQSGSETYVENFDLETSGIPVRDIYEPVLDKHFKGIDFTSQSSYTVPYGIQSADEGILWMQIKLDNVNYNKEEFLPLMVIGNMMLFKGSLVSSSSGKINEGLGEDISITNGNDIYIGRPHYYKKIGTWKKGEWHKILLQWSISKKPSECDDVHEYILAVQIDEDPIVRATIDCDDGCDGYTMSFCDEYQFPLSNSDKPTLLPPLNALSRFDIVPGAKTESGFFIDKLAVSKKSINDFMHEAMDEISTKNFPYLSNFDMKITVPKAPSSGETIIENIVGKCLIWNRPGEYGTLTIKSDAGERFSVGLSGSNLAILNPQDNLDGIRTKVVINCSYGGIDAVDPIILDIGDVQPFNLTFKQSKGKELQILIGKDEVAYIDYYISNIDTNTANLVHTLTSPGTVVLQKEDLGIVTDYHRWKIKSGTTLGTERLTLTISNPTMEEEIQAPIDVTVSENQPPEIYNWTPQQLSLSVTQGESVYFTHESRDDRSARVTYKWFIDEGTSPVSVSKGYDFSTSGKGIKTYRIKLEVFDDTNLKSYKEWTVTVNSRTSPVNTTNATDPNTLGGNCGNNVLEYGEECDGTKAIACGGWRCLSNCSCYKPIANETSSCIPHWECTSWSTCISGKRTRTCTDENICTVTASKPQEQESCTGDRGQSNTKSTEDDKTDQERDKDGTGTTPRQTSDSGTDESNSDGSEEADKTDTGIDIDSTDSDDLDENGLQSNLFVTLLWVLGGLCLIPIIIFVLGKLNKPAQQTDVPQSYVPQKSADPHYQKILDTVQWYKSKGMMPNNIYNMLIRMNFNKQQVYNAVYELFYLRR